MNIIKAIFLGIIEGVSEWLPISSTAHIKLFSILLKLDVSQDFCDVLEYVIKLGSLFALLLVFWNRINIFGVSKKPLGRGKLSYVKKDKLVLWSRILIAFIPSLIYELFLDGLFTFITPDNQMSFIAGAMIAVGILIIGVEIYINNKKPLYLTAKEVTMLDALAIGCSSLLANIFVGSSRLGVALIIALLLSIARTAAIEFSFESLIPVFAFTILKKLIGYGFVFSFDEILIMLFSVISAFVVSLYMIRFVVEYSKKNKFYLFGIYRIILGVIIIIYM